MSREIRLEKEVFRRLVEISELESRSVEDLANELLTSWLDRNFDYVMDKLEGYDEDDDEEEGDDDSDNNDDWVEEEENGDVDEEPEQEEDDWHRGWVDDEEEEE